MVYPLDLKSSLVELYEMTYRIRKVESKIAEEYSKGEMRCPVHLSIGQELTSAVFSIFQTKSDYAVSTHRAHAHYLAKGGDLRGMIAEIFGKVTGCSKGRGGSMHLSDPSVRFMGSSAIVGNSIPVGVGLAYGVRLRGESSRVFVFLGDGATEEGAFYESLNFSLIHSLPIVFVCENNLYSVYTGIESRQPRDHKAHKTASGLGMTSFYVPFGKADLTFQVFESALLNVKNGPIFIEVDTYRWLEHCGPNNDDHLEYRPENELAKHLDYDPLTELKKEIKASGRLNENRMLEIEKKVDSEVSEAFEFARLSPFPDKVSALGDFYGEQ